MGSLALLETAIVLVTLVCVVVRPSGYGEWVYATGGVLALAVLGRIHTGEVARVLARTGPVVVFLLAVTVLAAALERAGLFDALALAAGRAAGRSAYRLLAGVLLLGFAVTTVLSLDATAVLLTPAVVAIARRTQAPVLPLALACVWVANAGSLLLPVSNLTNLLAAGRLHGGLVLAAAMWPAQVTVLGVLWVLLAVWHRKALGEPLTHGLPSPASALEDHRAALVCGLATLLLVPVIVLTHGWTLAAATSAAAATAWAATRHAAPETHQPFRQQFPWRLGVFVIALFVVVDAAARGPLGALASSAASGAGPVRAGIAGALAANLLNNLPAYLLLAPHVADGAPLRGLLAGVNIGANLTPIGSLATLLWLAALRPHGLAPSPLRYLRWGLVVTPLTLFPALALLRLG